MVAVTCKPVVAATGSPCTVVLDPDPDPGDTMIPDIYPPMDLLKTVS